VVFHFPREAMGASGTRLSLRPPAFGRTDFHDSGAISAAGGGIVSRARGSMSGAK
jgi:hypothetical protein